LKQLSTIFLILIVLSQTFSRFVVEADYFINKDYIAKYLCINKDKLKMNCCGKCYLNKQLKKQDKQEQSGTTKKSNTEVQLFFHTYCNTIHTKLFGKKIQFYNSDNSRLATFPRFVFHPPAAV